MSIVENPWMVCSRLNNTLLSLHLNVNHVSPDFRKPSYNRPMVLMFPNKDTAHHFQDQHANTIRRSCVVMKKKRHFGQHSKQPEHPRGNGAG